LKTLKQCFIISIGVNYYYHFGLRNAIEQMAQYLRFDSNDIKLFINIDDLPLSQYLSEHAYGQYYVPIQKKFI